MGPAAPRRRRLRRARAGAHHRRRGVGGVYPPQPAPSSTLRETAHGDSFERALELIDKMRAGEVDLLLIHGANPRFELPAAAGFAQAAARAPFVVTFSPFVAATAVAG